MSTVITATDVSFELLSGRELFCGVNLSLGAGCTALVGPNGVGKTCLAQILAGLQPPTQGTVQRKGNVVFFPQRQSPGGVTVEAFLADEYQWSLPGEALLENIDRALLCTALSGGQWMRVRLACVLGEGFLILDEPTNDLDDEGRNAVRTFLQAHVGGALLISHDRDCLALCDDVLELSNQGIAKYGGGWSAYVAARDREREGLASALEDAKRERIAAATEKNDQLERQDKRNRRGAATAARGGMPKILLGGRKRRAQASTGKIDASTTGRADAAVRAAHEAYQQLKIDPVMYADLAGQPVHAGKLVAEARDFNIRYGRWLYPRDLNFSWQGPVRVAIQGANGSGKSTLVRALLGDTMETRGMLQRGKLSTLYLDQRLAALEDHRTVLQNVQDVSSKSETELRNGLARLLFAREAVFQKVGELSGGERLRAALARGLLATDAPQLLVLDEPTNNLDLANVQFLERIVAQFRGALLVISHDRVFLQNCGVVETFRVD